MNPYHPDLVDDIDEQTQLRRRARKAARTFEEQMRWEDDAPARFEALCDRLYAAGVRSWWPPFREPAHLWRWDLMTAGVRHRNGGGWRTQNGWDGEGRTWRFEDPGKDYR